MHSYTVQCNYYTVPSHLDCERKSSPNKITHLHSQWVSATKMTDILTQTWRRMRSSVHMPAVTVGISDYIVISVVCLHACVSGTYHIAFIAQIPLAVHVYKWQILLCLSSSILRWGWRNVGVEPVGFCFLMPDAKTFFAAGVEVTIHTGLVFLLILSFTCTFSDFHLSVFLFFFQRVARSHWCIRMKGQQLLSWSPQDSQQKRIPQRESEIC